MRRWAVEVPFKAFGRTGSTSGTEHEEERHKSHGPEWRVETPYSTDLSCSCFLLPASASRTSNSPLACSAARYSLPGRGARCTAAALLCMLLCRVALYYYISYIYSRHYISRAYSYKYKNQALLARLLARHSFPQLLGEYKTRLEHSPV